VEDRPRGPLSFFPPFFLRPPVGAKPSRAGGGRAIPFPFEFACKYQKIENFFFLFSWEAVRFAVLRVRDGSRSRPNFYDRSFLFPLGETGGLRRGRGATICSRPLLPPSPLFRFPLRARHANVRGEQARAMARGRLFFFFPFFSTRPGLKVAPRRGDFLFLCC